MGGEGHSPECDGSLGAYAVARDAAGGVSLSVEAMPSITRCCFVMGLSHASHTSPSAGPPQNLGVLLYGRRPFHTGEKLPEVISREGVDRDHSIRRQRADEPLEVRDVRVAAGMMDDQGVPSRSSHARSRSPEGSRKYPGHIDQMQRATSRHPISSSSRLIEARNSMTSSRRRATSSSG
jgi:hypothetical protein